MADTRTGKGKEIMKRIAFVIAGIAVGFVAAMGILPAARGAADDSTYGQFDLFAEAFRLVRNDYVHPVKSSELIDNAIQGMVSSLDPHSSYMDAKAYKDFQVTIKGQFGGLGIEVTMENGLIKVISPIDGTPAARAGIKANDKIAAIDGHAIMGMTLDQAINKMRGSVGSKVTLTIIRTGAKKPFDVTLTRAIIEVDAPSYKREGDVGYIRLPGFNEHTASGLEKAVRNLRKEIGPGIKGYILDLRNNPGGLLDQAIQVSDDFLNRGEIVSTRSRHAEDTQRSDAKPGDITGDKPVIVLVNGGTASAAEIVSGALQDNKRATIVGMTTFGKGSVQTLLPLSSGGVLRLTTALYFTPSGHSIQALGITPDIMVAEGNEDEIPEALRHGEADLPEHLKGEPPAKGPKAPIIRAAPGKKYTDFQLSYALDLLRGKKTVDAVSTPASSVH
jgi:carboxyl-terminal processing protease